MTKKSNLPFAVLCVLFLWALIAQFTFVGFLLYLKATADHNLPPPFITRVYTPEILHLAPGYEHSGLKIGDRVLAFNGAPVLGTEQIDRIRFTVHPGDTLTVRLRRGAGVSAKILDVPISMKAGPDDSPDWITIVVLRIFLPLSCTLVGFYIAFARPRDPLAWITMLMLASFGEVVSREPFWAVWSPWRELLLVYFSLLANAWPFLLLLFALYFPAPFPVVRRRPWLIYVLSVPFLLFVAAGLYSDLMEGSHFAEMSQLADFWERMENPIRLFFSVCVFAFFALLGFKNKIIREADARRRLNLLIAGCSAALFPLFLVILAEVGFLPPLPVWAVTACLIMLALFPITMAYVIVVQRAMDVRMVVRSGVRYALASTGVRIFRIALIAGTIAATVQLAASTGERWKAVAVSLIGTTLVFALRRLSLQFTRWMDRRFFREAYNAELVLTDLSNSVAGIRDTRSLFETVTRRIADSLHVLHISVLLERGDVFEPAYAVGFNGPLPAVQLRRNATSIRLLRQDHSASRIYFDDPQSWVHGAPESEQAALKSLRTQVLLPVALQDRLLGVISLGAKRSEMPYSRNDLKLLGAVASQTGLALENAQLTENIRREVAQRERIDRELEIAREVQQRLFPQKLPFISGLDFAGYCRPALGVGGDYYDFIRLDDGCLGIAIGDVSGKGIAAALMMASLQASLRGQIINPCSNLSQMIGYINRLLYDASAENRYATFFYAQYNPLQRRLTYVNAGHNAPILLRRETADSTVVRLEEGGAVVGLFPDFVYGEAQLELQPGDTFIGFTDGISEAMDNADEEYGEDRLLDAIREARSGNAADILAHLLEKVDAFTAGAPQHDDMTLVVMCLR